MISAPPFPAWTELSEAALQVKSKSLAGLFEDDPERVNNMSCKAAGLFLDYSKNLCDQKALGLLHQLGREAELKSNIGQLMRGDKINNTENRAALHTLLRASEADIPAYLEAEFTEVHAALEKIKVLCERVRTGQWRGFSNKPVSNLLVLGIGGSFLGPNMVDEGLASLREPGFDCHYVANVDAHHLTAVLAGLNPETTLVCVVSKTFTTLETRCNAETTRRWLLQQMAEADLARHVIAVSSNVKMAIDFGIDEDNIFPMWDWVGGRYSLWSAVGLPVAIRYGFEAFEQLLAGAREMDQHFRNAPLTSNMPWILASLSIWYQHFFGAESHAVLTYDHRLRLLPDHLQQLDMESNGKSVNRNGEQMGYPTGPVIWGGEGTNGQHAFHQLLHQGTRFVPIDFIIAITPDHSLQEHHDKLVASCLSQSQALMLGRSLEELGDDPAAAHRVMPGNRPSNTIMLERLSPRTLGALVALYEHKVFCQAVIWQINPFDQWGVELGKELGEGVYKSITEGGTSLDPSTTTLIERYRQSLKRNLSN